MQSFKAEALAVVSLKWVIAVPFYFLIHSFTIGNEIKYIQLSENQGQFESALISLSWSRNRIRCSSRECQGMTHWRPHPCEAGGS